MILEHLALNVPDPVALAAWYTQHLGMRVLRGGDTPPYGHFLVDGAGRTVLEVYCQAAPVLDYRAMDPLTLHIAFAVGDVPATRQRLIAAGASAVGEVVTASSGDVLAMLRDPWGIAVQLVKRSRPMLEK